MLHSVSSTSSRRLLSASSASRLLRAQICRGICTAAEKEPPKEQEQQEQQDLDQATPSTQRVESWRLGDGGYGDGAYIISDELSKQTEAATDALRDKLVSSDGVGMSDYQSLEDNEDYDFEWRRAG